MKEKKFLKKIKEKDNENGVFTYMEVCQLLSKERENLPSKKQNILKRFINKFYKPKTATQIIRDNFELIFSKTDNDIKICLLWKMMEYPEMTNIIKENFCLIINNLKDLEAFINNFIKQSEENKKFIIDNTETIINNIKLSQLFDIVQILKKMPNAKIELLNSKLEQNKLEVIASLFCTENVLEGSPIDYEKLIDNMYEYHQTLMRMFDELLESENKKMIDIEYLSSGGYSDVYKIGDSVIKIGGPRKKYKIINHRRILQPLTRTNFLDLENNEPFACIEIAPAVETNLEDELTEEELYKIYKELRDDGIIWTDCKDINVGRLTRENVPKLNSEEIDIAPESIGADQKPKGEILKKGDYVIIDSDYIYKENDPDISFAGSKWSLSKKFEQKYQREKQSEIAKRYKKVKIISNENEKDNLNDVPNL